MNSLTHIMSYDKTKSLNQENCNCEKFISVKRLENQTVEIPKLSEEEIDKIIFERYSDKDEKTKEFIRKALRKHGDRYDYSNVSYVKATVNVEIICRIEGHKPFPQTPNNHLSGKGCKLCGIKRNVDKQRMTLEEFIKHARKIHGDKYDYSKVNYVNMNTEVIITCSKHGDFPQTPHNHLQGHGCFECSNELIHNKQRFTTEEFIENSNKVHGIGRYDYSKVKYINYVTDVMIICYNHDEPYEFPQTPREHLSGKGCPMCGGCQKSTTEEFIEKANKVQGFGTYDYSKVKYVDAQTEVIIICHNHDEPYEFPQTPNNHLSGKGCPLCNESQGEKKIRIFLTNNKIEFEREKRFNDCRYKRPLPFDFYLPQHNLCIEYDGKQHFNPSSFHFKNITEEEKLKNFEYIQNNDKIKNEYCKYKGIDLLRIRYDENVEEKLSKYFLKL